MKYALISDIHGNYPALKAVLEDAKQQNVEKYILVGDYVQDFPWPNEVVNALRALTPAVIVRGNKEDYLNKLHGTDERTWIYEQMAPTYWNYRELTPENLSFLLALPREAEVRDENGGILRIAHTSDIFFGEPRIEPFYSSHYVTKMKAASLTHENYLKYAREAVCGNPASAAKLNICPPGVNIFGHNHLQWYMQYGDTLHVNPGSCGVPSDFEANAPYTIIEYINGAWAVAERRVTYDLEAAAQGLRSSSLYEQAAIWSDIIIDSLYRAEDIMTFFIRHVHALAESFGQPTQPASNEIWRLAYQKWKEQ